MKKIMICLVVLFVALGLCATVYAQAGGNQTSGGPSKLKICKPGQIPVLSYGRTQYFQAKSHFQAQCTCNQVAERYAQYSCYAVALAEGPLWSCLCSKTKK